jgi:hypothetical protein
MWENKQVKIYCKKKIKKKDFFLLLKKHSPWERHNQMAT